MDNYGISLTCPAEAPATGPIPVAVEMRADPRTYWDNDGILDKALTVALVRKDRPGLRFLPKIDPHAIMLPDEPLPGRPSDEQLDEEKWMVSELKTLDASAPDEALRGMAEYFVTAGFSTWWVGPSELRTTDPNGREAPAPTPDLAPDGRPWPVRPLAPGSVSTARLQPGEAGSVLVMPFHVDLSKLSLPPDTQVAHLWLTILGFCLDSKGGACGGIFAVDVERTSATCSGEISIVLSSLAPSATAGKWLFQGFIGQTVLSPAEVTLTDDDVR